MRKRQGLTLAEVVVLLVGVAVVAVCVVAWVRYSRGPGSPASDPAGTAPAAAASQDSPAAGLYPPGPPPIGDRAQDRKARCTFNLNKLAIGLTLYRMNHDGFYPCPLGRSRTPNDYSGAEWLATLYWVRRVENPDVFLCPSSGDANHRGTDLGASKAPPSFGSQTVSYAGLHYRSLNDSAGRRIASAIQDDLPPGAPIASDDTQGTINHGRRGEIGMNILFADTHIEFRSSSRIDARQGVGRKNGLLWQLRN